jgi:hypothetical protein
MMRAAVAAVISALAYLILTPHPAAAQSNSILDRVRERAASRATTTTENRANEQVDQTVDKTVDCMFNPVECAKQKSQTAPAPAPAPGEVGATPAADTTEWYAEKAGERVGPMPREQLAAMVTSGQVTTATLVWREGLNEWKPAGEVAELGDVFKKVPPPLPRRSGPPPLPAQR